MHSEAQLPCLFEGDHRMPMTFLKNTSETLLPSSLINFHLPITQDSGQWRQDLPSGSESLCMALLEQYEKNSILQIFVPSNIPPKTDWISL